jgi:hypothetical protein
LVSATELSGLSEVQDDDDGGEKEYKQNYVYKNGAVYRGIVFICEGEC